MNRIRPTDVVTVKRFLLMETGTYNDQFLRSYRIGADTNTVNYLADTVANKKGANLNSTEVSAIAHNVISPTTEVTGRIEIDNGWSTKRYSFYLEIEYRTSELSNAKTIETIIGYTDFKDSVNQIHNKNNPIDGINPDTKFYITAINTTRCSVVETGTHPVNNVSSIQRKQVIMNNGFKLSDNNYNTITPVIMSPGNIFNRLATESLTGDFNNSGIGNSEINNTIGNVNNFIPEYNDRNNNSSSLYLTNLLNSFSSAKLEKNMDGDMTGTTMDDTYQAAFDKVNDSHYNNGSDYLSSFNNTPMIMNKINMIEGGQNRNSFKLKTLYNIDPNFNHVSTVINDYTGNMGLSVRGQTQIWDSVDPNTMFAVTLANSIPTYMLKCLLGFISFTVTNQNIENRVDFMIGADPKSYSQIGDISYLINAFKHALIEEVIRGYTQDFKCGFYIKCTVNILLEISLEVSINGLPMTPYITPAFSDNLIAPTITTSDGLVNLLSELNGIFQEIDYSINSTHSYANRVISQHSSPLPSFNFGSQNNYNL